MEIKPKHTYHFAEILPNNERVREKQRLLREQEEHKEAEELRKKKLDEEFNIEKEMKMKKEEREKRQKLIDLENMQQSYKDRVKIVEKGEGNLNAVFESIIRNTSPYELSFAGFKLDAWDFTTMMVLLHRNTSLLTLNLSRKGLNDSDAQQIANMLIENKKLRRLELEGNCFGPLTGVYFGNALKVNKTLRYLDLENNKLTNRGDDISGILALFEGLKSNTMLISLNLTGNTLGADCGGPIISCLRNNKTLIHLEYFDNKDFEEKNNVERREEMSKYKSTGLDIHQIEEIKSLLSFNRDAYDKMRTMEWKERKQMRGEFEDINNLTTKLEEINITKENKLKEKEAIEQLYLDQYNRYVKDLENQFTADVDKFFAETKERLAKKNKKKPTKKKK